MTASARNGDLVNNGPRQRKINDGPAQTSFRNGDLVKVRTANPPTHYRTPVYVQGKTGRVVALCGIYPDPESLAHGGDGSPHQPLYRVEFPQTTLWDDYAGPSADRLQVDIYEHWLERTS